jgi:hypothetical protein
MLCGAGHRFSKNDVISGRADRLIKDLLRLAE